MPAIEIPTVGGIQRAMLSYGVGVLAGVGYNAITKITGSGLIGGAISAGAIGAMVKGPMGDTLAAVLGFASGRQGLPGLNLGGLGGLLGGGGGTGQETPYTLI